MGDTTTVLETLASERTDPARLDEAYAALVDPLRRTLLVVLARLETPERRSTLARTIVVETAAFDEASADDVHLRLHHVHVPKLADAGFLAVDAEDETVELTDRGEWLASVLDG